MQWILNRACLLFNNVVDTNSALLCSRHLNHSSQCSHLPSRPRASGGEQREKCLWPPVARSIGRCAESAARLMKSCTNKHSALSAHSLGTETHREDGAPSRRSTSWQHDWLQVRRVFVSPSVIRTQCASVVFLHKVRLGQDVALGGKPLRWNLEEEALMSRWRWRWGDDKIKLKKNVQHLDPPRRPAVARRCHTPSYPSWTPASISSNLWDMDMTSIFICEGGEEADCVNGAGLQDV